MRWAYLSNKQSVSDSFRSPGFVAFTRPYATSLQQASRLQACFADVLYSPLSMYCNPSRHAIASRVYTKHTKHGVVSPAHCQCIAIYVKAACQPSAAEASPADRMKTAISNRFSNLFRPPTSMLCLASGWSAQKGWGSRMAFGRGSASTACSTGFP